MSAVPASPASVLSSASSVSSLDPSARERIAANKRRAQQKLAARDQRPQQQQAVIPDFFSNGSPARPPPAPSSARDVIVLDSEDDSDWHGGAARPLFGERDSGRRRVDRVQLTEAEREERRLDDEEQYDSTDGDVEVDVRQRQPNQRHDRGQHNTSNLVSKDYSYPPLPLAAPTPHVPPSARIAASTASSNPAPSSRQGGSSHYLHFRSRDISDSSFATLAPMPGSYRDSQSPPTLPHAASPTASTQPPVNPFTSTATTYRVTLTSADTVKPPPPTSFTSPSLASSLSQPHRPAVPHVPPHRQDELRSEEEKHLWALFDKAKHPSHPARQSHQQRTPNPASYSASTASHSAALHGGQSNGSGVRKLPSVFDSVAFRLEERQDRDRKRRKKEHPLLEERRNAKRLRAAPSTSFPSNPSPLPVPIQPSSSSRFSNPPPPSASRPPAANGAPAVSKPHRKTQLLVDPRVAAAERAREERQQRLQQDQLTQQRLKPSLDELHSTVLSWSPLQLDTTVRASLETQFVRVPLTFADDVEYQTVFYPLLLEECRAEMMATMSEVTMAQEERAAEHANSKLEAAFNPRGLLEVVSIVSYEKVNSFHHIDVDRVDFDSTKRSSLFTSDDLVLLWYRPSATDPFEPNEWKTASLHTLARLERVHDRDDAAKKADRRKPAVHYKLQVHVEHSGGGAGGGGTREEGDVDGKKLIQFLLRGGSQWGVVKVMTLITVHRQYRALQSCHMLSLFPFLMRPNSSSTRDKGGVSTALNVLRQFPAELIRSFNPSQREAMATAMVATDGITLIQGPPGTGKTKTIVGLINLLLLQPPGDAAKSAVTHSISGNASSSLSSSSSRPAASSINGRILVCAPSNAAIDEIVARVLQPESLVDRAGRPLRPRIVRVGAGKRLAGKDVVQAQHSGVDIDAVSLDRLVEDRMKANERKGGHDQDGGEGGEAQDESKEKASEADVGDYDRALDRLRVQLDEVHEHIHTLEEKKNAADVITLDAGEKDKGERQETANKQQQEDVHQLLDAAHKRRKVLLAERKHVHGKKDTLLQRLRKRHQLIADNREALRLSILNESHIVCTTLTGAGLDLFSSSTASFDCVVIDEAAQAIEVQTLIPLKYECKRCVMVGDDRQLSATVISQSATRYSYQQSLFSRLRKCGVSVKVIEIQYRMHPHIRLFPSTFFYQSQLRDAPSLLASAVVQRHVGLLHPLGSVGLTQNFVDKRIAPYVFYDVKGTESRAGHASLHNVTEARVATRVFLLLYAAAQRAHSAVSSTPFPVADFISDVGVVTPYKQQVATLRQHFRALFSTHSSLSPFVAQLEVSTVDSFQGREKSFVLFSAVRAHSVDRAGGGSGIGFVADANRLNVALTRARQCLAVLGSARTLSKEPIWQSLIDDARRRQCVVDVQDGDTALFNDRLHSDRWRAPLDPTMWGVGTSDDDAPSGAAAPVAEADRAERRSSLGGGSSGGGSGGSVSGADPQRGRLVIGERRDSGSGLVRRQSGDRLTSAAADEGIKRSSIGQRQVSDERKDRPGGTNRIPKLNRPSHD